MRIVELRTVDSTSVFFVLPIPESVGLPPILNWADRVFVYTENLLPSYQHAVEGTYIERPTYQLRTEPHERSSVASYDSMLEAQYNARRAAEAPKSSEIVVNPGTGIISEEDSNV